MYGFGISRDHELLERIDHRIGEWGVQVSEYLPETLLLDDTGAQVGLLLGWAIHPEDQRMFEGSEIVGRVGEVIEDLHERSIRPLIGTYLVILNVDRQTRIYMDGLGSLSVVFDPHKGVAGSTAACILSETEYQAQFDRELHKVMEIEREGWFPAGLTAHRGVERLMANHFLDCRKWVQMRHTHYEKAIALATSPSSGTIQQQYKVLAAQTLQTTNALLDVPLKVTVGLTGGGDSRLLLAALKPVKERVGFYTVSPPKDAADSFDLIRASEISERFGLIHETLPFVYANDAEAGEWDRRVSHCVVTANRRQHPSVYPLQDQICIGGLGGEVGRCFLWPNLAKIPAISAITLVDMLKLPRVPQVVARVEKWLAALPEMPVTHLLDLAYIELRMSAWSSVQSYANPKSIIVHPLGGYTSIEAMLSLPPSERQNDGMIEGVILDCWPELLNLPINRFGDWRDLKKPVAKFTNPTKVFRKLRQLVRSR